MSEVGLYSFGCNIGNMVTLAIGTPVISGVWPTIRRMETRVEEQRAFVRQVTTYVCVAGAALAMGLSIFAHELIRLLASRPEFVAAAVVVPLLTFSQALQGLAAFTEAGITLGNKPAYCSVTAFAAAAVNLGLGFLLIHRFGILGAGCRSIDLVRGLERAQSLFLDEVLPAAVRRTANAAFAPAGSASGGRREFLAYESEPAHSVAVKEPLGHRLPRALGSNRLPHAGRTPNSDWTDATDSAGSTTIVTFSGYGRRSDCHSGTHEFGLAMCGICGVYEYASEQSVDRARLERMNRTLLHRGPDEEGTFLRPQIGLAMRRLRIIDLAGGSQPIANEDETVWIVFNGEIYNFRELRRDLTRRGHRFRTDGDTEVIVHAYEEFGERCVEFLDGMFAFAIYDGRPQTLLSGPRLFLARDPFGKKPLYYADCDGALIFGSEIKPILQDPRVSRDIDFEALHHYLSLLVVPAPLSIFHAIRKLPAGHVLLADELASRCDPTPISGPSSRPMRSRKMRRTSRLRDLLFRAVEKRLVADVPLGAFLSGGLDSSLIVAIMSPPHAEAG